MSDLPTPVPYVTAPRIDPADLRAAFAGVAPGGYRSVDLLPRYNAWAIREGKPTVTAKALGEWIVRLWHPARTHAHGHIKVYELTTEHLGES